MSGLDDRVALKVHTKIFREQVLPKSGMAEKASHERPAAIILGGQPGAGKGSLARRAEAELRDDVVRIDPDALRNYHPRIREFRAANPYTWSGRTQADAGQWAGELREAAVAGRRNFIFDITLSNGSWLAGLIRDLQTTAARTA